MDLEINQSNAISIDRFEGNYAVCEILETGKIINIPKKDLPVNSKPGSILNFKNGKYVLNIEATNQEQTIVRNMVSNLFKKKN